MCEFEPFNFLSALQQMPAQQNFDEPISLLYSAQQNSLDIEVYAQTEQSSSQTQNSNSKQKSSHSKFHNMTKQLVITMKQIMGPSMKDFGSTLTIRRIIKSVWEKLIKQNHPNKQTLMAMFGQEINLKILKKQGLIETENQYSLEDFKQAMLELKEEVLLRMRQSTIRSNLTDRRILNKELLLAYILHFLHEELQNGEIKARFGSHGARKIDLLVDRSKKEENYVSEFLF